MSAACANRIDKLQPWALISCDRLHLVAFLPNAVMKKVRRQRLSNSATDVRNAVGSHSKKGLHQLLWTMRKETR